MKNVDIGSGTWELGRKERKKGEKWKRRREILERNTHQLAIEPTRIAVQLVVQPSSPQRRAEFPTFPGTTLPAPPPPPLLVEAVATPVPETVAPPPALTGDVMVPFPPLVEVITLPAVEPGVALAPGVVALNG
ncbi:hypothetical protein FRC17_010204 [Serendipita sp. 399]|nr:hypothetical protein FRC17_010204 [Serendipita sp. 399]